MVADALGVDQATDERLQSRVGARRAHRVELAVGQVTDARAEAKAERWAECKQVVAHPAGVGVVLLDLYGTLVVGPDPRFVSSAALSENV